MLVSLLEATMVVFDDGVEEVSENGVRLSVRGVDAHPRVRVLDTYNTQS